MMARGLHTAILAMLGHACNTPGMCMMSSASCLLYYLITSLWSNSFKVAFFEMSPFIVSALAHYTLTYPLNSAGVYFTGYSNSHAMMVQTSLNSLNVLPGAHKSLYSIRKYLHGKVCASFDDSSRPSPLHYHMSSKEIRLAHIFKMSIAKQQRKKWLQKIQIHIVGMLHHVTELTMQHWKYTLVHLHTPENRIQI